MSKDESKECTILFIVLVNVVTLYYIGFLMFGACLISLFILQNYS